ncbi:MAG: D-aminoacyl-tRNA deacylase [Planctomycetota bacterium]|nr:MAG: D-aminoacyl-tRNA deacylase [Planctomycetota bacterium]
MRVVAQRVARARVWAEGIETGAIGRGLVLLAAFRAADGEAELDWMARRCAALRVFPDEHDRNNLSLLDIGGEALVISQFTLYGDASRGNRPSYVEAAPPALAAGLYERFCELLAARLGRQVARGRFGAHMRIEMLADGPVTILLEREAAAARG